MTRTRWLWVLAAAVLVVGVVVATIWLIRGDDGSSTAISREDCEVVGALAREWVAMPRQDQTGGVRSGQFANRIRIETESVAAPALKQDLNKWADGFTLLALIQRTEAKTPSPDDAAKVSEAGEAIYETADELREACPDAWPPRP